jgi:bifunctional ADP-heptose synthase (sugar kinase/adenylyltransferase)
MAERNAATELIQQIRGQSRLIVVIGDSIIDRWLHGTIEDSQDRCKKFTQYMARTTPGGAANAANSLKEWDVKVKLIQGDNASIKTRCVVDGIIEFRLDEDQCASEPNCDLMRNGIFGWIEQASAVLLSDYNKGFLTPKLIELVVDMCDRLGVPCVADCKRAPKVYQGCILKGNQEWFHRYNVPNDRLVVTYGVTPPIVDGEKLRECLTLPMVKCVNHVGAGDCFAAHLTLAVAYGFSLRRAAVLANSAGRVYVQHHYSRAPLPIEIEADLSNIWQQ